MSTLLPSNPVPGTIVEVVPGVFLQYDQAVRSWVEIIATDLAAGLATGHRDGLMSSEDLRKLNRLVLPPPRSSLTAQQCRTVFGSGNLVLRGLDDMVRVTGNRELLYGDVDGTTVSRQLPFQIHQHTFGFDFGLSLDHLLLELGNRGQLVLQGARGRKGARGRRGPKGDEQLLTGPVGDRGDPGDSPPCGLTLARETYPARVLQDLKRVIVGLSLEPDPNDDSRYAIVAQRQVVGIPDSAAQTLHLGGDQSPWVLALAAATGPQPVYYLDVDPLVEAIHQKFLSEVQRLKRGFEAVVLMWLQKMSDLFDEQKLALCCALEFCQSRKSNTDSRRHIEMASAVSVGKGKASVHDRTGQNSLEFKVAPDCNPAGFPDLGAGSGAGGTAAGGTVGGPEAQPPPDPAGPCMSCWLTGPGAPDSVAVTDKFGAFSLQRSAVGFGGCRLVPAAQLPAICNDDRLVPGVAVPLNRWVPIYYEIRCLVFPPREWVALQISYPGCPGARGGPPAAGQACPPPGSQPQWDNPVQAITGGQPYVQLPFTSCRDETYTFDVPAPGIYGTQHQIVTVQKGAAQPPAPPPPPPPQQNFPAADARRCLFGPDSPSPPVSLGLQDPRFGELQLAVGTSRALGGIQVWTACRMVTVRGSTDPHNCTNPQQVQVPLRYDLFVQTTAQGVNYGLRLAYPSCISSNSPGTPTPYNSAVAGQAVTCEQMDSDVPNIWVGVSSLPFTTCSRPLDLSFAVDLPSLYGGGDVGVQAVPVFRVREYPTPPPAPPPSAAVGCDECLHTSRDGLPPPARFFLDDGGSDWATLTPQRDGSFAGCHRLSVLGTEDCRVLQPVAVPVVYRLSCVDSRYKLTISYPACPDDPNDLQGDAPTNRAGDGTVLGGADLYTKWPRVVTSDLSISAGCARPFSQDLDVQLPALYSAQRGRTAGLLFLRETLPDGASSSPVYTLPAPPPPPNPQPASCEWCLYPPYGYSDTPRPAGLRYSDRYGDVLLRSAYQTAAIGAWPDAWRGVRPAAGGRPQESVAAGCQIVNQGLVSARTDLSLTVAGQTVTRSYSCFPPDGSGIGFTLPDRAATLRALYPLPLPGADPASGCADCLLRDGFNLVLSGTAAYTRMHRNSDVWSACQVLPVARRSIHGGPWETISVPVWHFLSCARDADGGPAVRLRLVWPTAGPAGSPDYAPDEVTALDFKNPDSAGRPGAIDCTNFDSTKYYSDQVLQLPWDGCTQPLRLTFPGVTCPVYTGQPNYDSVVVVLQVGADPVPGLDPGGGPPPSFPEAQVPPLKLSARPLPEPADYMLVLDAVQHSGTAAQGVELQLPPGNYLVSIARCCPQLEGQYHAPVRISYRKGGQQHQVRFLDKGRWDEPQQARAAYENLSLLLEHEGGPVRAHLAALVPERVGGGLVLRFVRQQDAPAGPTQSCKMDVSKLAWYEKGWRQQKCCGAVVSLGGQDWIVWRRSIGSDTSCGGGDMSGAPCNSRFGNPAYAWPTFDGHEFAGLPSAGTVEFYYDPELSREVATMLARGEYTGRRGDLGGMGIVLFPLADQV